MKHEVQEIDRIDFGPVVRERPDRFGSVPGLEDEELADPEELERMVFLADWGPILALPAGPRTGFRPSIDELGHIDRGAFGTVDFERLYGKFDKARYKADKLREELRYVIIHLGTLLEHVPGKAKYSVLRYLRMGVIDLEHIQDQAMQSVARWFFRSQRLRREIDELREVSFRRRRKPDC